MYDGFSLKDKNAIITGATRGIGLAIAQGFLESGATVTLCGRKQEGIDEALETLAEHRDNVQGISAHVGQPDDLERLVDQAGSRFGNVNVLVNNAGTNPYYGPIVDSEDWAWDKTMEVNLKGPYMLSKRVARKMIDAGSGSIVNIASVAGLTSFEEQGIYSTSKAGLIMLTKVLARELGSAGVRANCICPGVIKTRLSRALWEDEAEQESASLKALGRVGDTGEIVGAAIYFASEASSFTTGSVLQIDGGMVI